MWYLLRRGIMKKISLCLGLLFFAFFPLKAFADMSDLQRVHSDIHAQVKGTVPAGEGRTGGAPSAQRDMGHG
jgi:hypothetical protein